MEQLIGKTIIGIALQTDGSQISFMTDKHVFMDFEAVGDCCSTSWIEEIDGLEITSPFTVTSVEEKMIDSTWDEDESTNTKIYSMVLRGLLADGKGHAIEIEFRNDSNGYYGGSLELVNSSEDNY